MAKSAISKGRGRPMGTNKVKANSECEALICSETIKGSLRPAIGTKIKEELGVTVGKTTIWKVQNRKVIREVSV